MLLLFFLYKAFAYLIAAFEAAIDEFARQTLENAQVKDSQHHQYN